jgi:hypothetical protein
VPSSRQMSRFEVGAVVLLEVVVLSWRWGVVIGARAPRSSWGYRFEAEAVTLETGPSSLRRRRSFRAEGAVVFETRVSCLRGARRHWSGAVAFELVVPFRARDRRP